MNIIIAAIDTSGTPAILTAIAGAIVSVYTVYRNAKRQDKATQDNTDLINDLTDQIKGLTNQIIDLKATNAALQTELTILKSAQIKTQAVVDYMSPEPRPKPKKKKKGK